MRTRIISGLVMTPIIIALIYFGGWPLLIGCCAVSLAGLQEFYDAFERGTAQTKYPVRPYHAAGFAAVIALYAVMAVTEPWLSYYDALTAYENVIFGSYVMLFIWLVWAGIWVLLILTVLALLQVFRAGDRDTQAFLKWYIYPWDRKFNTAVSGLGFMYIAYFVSHIVRIDMLREYRVLIWLVFITAFGTDVFAYFTGVFLGKHKLCPKISPKKTIEGSVGGIIGSALLSGVFGYLFAPEIWIHCVVIGLLGSVAAQAGDLTASAFKRKLGIKDYGNLIPGHGGVLDRFDSVLFTAPFVYYYAVLLNSADFWIIIKALLVF